MPQSIINILTGDGWFTPNTYNSSTFSPLPESKAICALVQLVFNDYNHVVDSKIVYVGMSLNVHRRIKSHEVIRHFVKKKIFLHVYFKKVSTNIRKTEKEYIKRFSPPFNLQHRVKEVV